MPMVMGSSRAKQSWDILSDIFYCAKGGDQVDPVHLVRRSKVDMYAKERKGQGHAYLQAIERICMRCYWR